MLIGCCHCGPLDSVSSTFASSAASISASQDSNDTGTGCFCVGSVSANTWRMDIDYGWNAQQGANIWCCALYRKQKSYLLRRVATEAGVCYWESNERAGTTPDNDPYLCQTYAPYPRAWMQIHGPGSSGKWWGSGFALSAGLLYKNSNVISAPTVVLPYAYRQPDGGPFGQARPGFPINCLTAKTLDHWTTFYGPTIPRRWIGASGSLGVTQFPCGTGFGTTSNDLIPPTITLTPVAS